MALLLESGSRSLFDYLEAEELTAHRAEPQTTTRRAEPLATRAAAREAPGTLDDLISGAWEGLTAAASPPPAPCARGELAPRWSAGAGVVGGRCRDCGSELVLGRAAEARLG